MSNGIMTFNETRVEVVNVIPHEQDGRTGWLASDAFATGVGHNPRLTQLFYPADLFTFEETL